MLLKKRSGFSFYFLVKCILLFADVAFATLKLEEAKNLEYAELISGRFYFLFEFNLHEMFFII